MNKEIKEPAQITAISRKPGISTIIGEYHDHNVHYIAERMAGRYFSKQYRLKTVSYTFFPSEKELIAFCSDHEIQIGRPPQNAKENRSTPDASKQAKGNTSFGLSDKEYRFCIEYLRSHNATRAYMIANPHIKNANSAAACASVTLKKAAVKAYLARMQGK